MELPAFEWIEEPLEPEILHREVLGTSPGVPHQDRMVSLGLIIPIHLFETAYHVRYAESMGKPWLDLEIMCVPGIDDDRWALISRDWIVRGEDQTFDAPMIEPEGGIGE